MGVVLAQKHGSIFGAIPKLEIFVATAKHQKCGVPRCSLPKKLTPPFFIEGRSRMSLYSLHSYEKMKCFVTKICASVALWRFIVPA